MWSINYSHLNKNIYDKEGKNSKITTGEGPRTVCTWQKTSYKNYVNVTIMSKPLTTFIQLTDTNRKKAVSCGKYLLAQYL